MRRDDLVDELLHRALVGDVDVVRGSARPACADGRAEVGGACGEVGDRQGGAGVGERPRGVRADAALGGAHDEGHASREGEEVVHADTPAYDAAARPASRPNTPDFPTDVPVTYPAPWNPPVTSPAANRPWICSP